MSKFDESFTVMCAYNGINLDGQFAGEIREYCRLIWNARGKVDAEICKPYEDYPGEHAEAIEKENEND